MPGDWHIGGHSIVKGSTASEKKCMFCLLKVGKWGGKVGRLMGVLGGSGEEGPHDHSVVRQVSQRTREGHALGMSKQFECRSNPLAGWRKLCGWVMQLCSMRLFSAEFLLLTNLESVWGGALGSACRTVSLGLRSPDQLQCYRQRERGCCWEMDPFPSSSFLKAIWYVGLFYLLAFFSKASASAGGR